MNPQSDPITALAERIANDIWRLVYDNTTADENYRDTAIGAFQGLILKELAPLRKVVEAVKVCVSQIIDDGGDCNDGLGREDISHIHWERRKSLADALAELEDATKNDGVAE